MNCDYDQFMKMPNWYPYLSAHAFPTTFVRLRPDAIEFLALDEIRRRVVPKEISKLVVEDLGKVMSRISGNCFTSVETCSPTDTERFRTKRGAVYSPESAWRYLCLSEKVHQAAIEGNANFVCLRPFRRINPAREFRLFICNGELAAMSQYWLTRHFPQLDKDGKVFWKKAEKLVKQVIWQFPVDNFVMDIYVTSSGKLLIIDLNPWGNPTDPLLLRSWDRDDWKDIPGLQVMQPPTKISGDVNISF